MDAPVKWTVYVDLDAFYVACEVRDQPQLAGRPVIVGPSPRQGPSRGVVLSASYEARAFGVRSAMPVNQADRLCPDATWIAPDFSKYARVSGDVRQLLERSTPKVIALSIDEAAMPVDLPDAEAARQFARGLQAELKDRLGLSASFGVAPYRIVAKIATDQAKPGGVLVVPPEAVAEFLAPLPVRAIPGVGPKTEALLREGGVGTIGDLAEGAPSAVRRRLGNFADELVLLATGEPHESDLDVTGAPHSRSVDHTLLKDAEELPEVQAVLAELAQSLGEGLARDHLRYQTVTVAVRWADFTRVQRSRSLPAAIEGAATLRSVGARLLEELWATQREGRALRLVSLRAERLHPSTDRQRRLDDFSPPERARV